MRGVVEVMEAAEMVTAVVVRVVVEVMEEAETVTAVVARVAVGAMVVEEVAVVKVEGDMEFQEVGEVLHIHSQVKEQGHNHRRHL